MHRTSVNLDLRSRERTRDVRGPDLREARGSTNREAEGARTAINLQMMQYDYGDREGSLTLAKCREKEELGGKE